MQQVSIPTVHRTGDSTDVPEHNVQCLFPNGSCSAPGGVHYIFFFPAVFVFHLPLTHTNAVTEKFVALYIKVELKEVIFSQSGLMHLIKCRREVQYAKFAKSQKLHGKYLINSRKLWLHFSTIPKFNDALAQSWHEFKNSIAAEIEPLHLQPIINHHFHLFIVVESSLMQYLEGCLFYSNEKVEMAIREWLRMQEHGWFLPTRNF